MKSPTLSSLALLALLSPLVVQAAAPLNDSFANATVITSRTVTLFGQDGSKATAEKLDPYIAGPKATKSLWYRFDSTFLSAGNRVIVNHTAGARYAVFSLIDADGGLGTLVNVGTPPNIVQGGNNNPGTDTLTFNITTGMRYYICVDTPGQFDLTLMIAGQANDYFQDATVLVGNKGMINGSNLNCSNVGDTPVVSTSPTAGVWYKWVPTVTAQMGVSTNFSFLSPGALHDTVLYIFSSADDTLANLVQVGFDDDSGIGFNSRASFAATAGTTYYIWVCSFAIKGGPFHLEYFAESDPGEFSFTSSTTSVNEDQGLTNVEVRRHYAGMLPAAVTVTSSNGSATAGSDYTAVTSVLSFPAGGTGSLIPDSSVQAFVNVPILQDTVLEANETFGLTLSAPTAGAVLGSPVTIAVSIVNAPTIGSAAGFAVTTMTVHENDGIISIPLERVNAQGDGSVSVTVGSGTFETAVNGVDYLMGTNSATTVPFPDGVGRRFLGVTIVNDGRSNGTRTFVLKTSPISQGQSLDGSSSVVVTILDDEKFKPVPGRIIALLGSGTAFTGINGTLDARITVTGTLTGKLITNRGTFAFAGKLDATGSYAFTYGTAPATRTLSIQLVNPATNIYQVGLGDEERGGFTTRALFASNFSAAYPCPNAAMYTEADTGNGGTLPQFTAASLKVDTLGNATLTGKAFDGTAFIATGGVDAGGLAVMGASLYTGQGRVTLSVVLPVFKDISATGFLQFVRPGSIGENMVLPPVELSCNAPVALYRYTPGTRLLPVWNATGTGRALFTSAGYIGEITQNISVSAANVVTLSGVGEPSLKLTLTPATGMATGTVIPPGTLKPQTITAALLQLGAVNSIGRGFFLNPATPTAEGKLELKGP